MGTAVGTAVGLLVPGIATVTSTCCAELEVEMPGCCCVQRLQKTYAAAASATTTKTPTPTRMPTKRPSTSPGEGGGGEVMQPTSGKLEKIKQPGGRGGGDGGAGGGEGEGGASGGRGAGA